MEPRQEFTAVDGQGNKYRLLVYQQNVRAGTRGEPSTVIPGQKRIVTEDGKSVNRLKKGEYEIVETHVVLRSSDPDAP